MRERGIHLIEGRFRQHHLCYLIKYQEDNDDEKEDVDRIQEEETFDQLESRDEPESE